MYKAAILTSELTPVARGDVVAVLGVGRLGTLICAAASALGARVIAISRSKLLCCYASSSNNAVQPLITV